MTAVITASSVLCAGGRGTEQLWATVRAGIACIGNSHVMDKNFNAIQMGLVPEDELAPLPPEFQALPFPAGARRMLRLAGPTLAAIGQSGGPAPLTVYLGLPHVEFPVTPWLDDFMVHLGNLAGVAIDDTASRIFPMGRAAAILALEAAVDHISKNPAAVLVVGGVDSFLDLRRIASLDDESRILGPRVMDGFIPGEGAAFFILKDAAHAQGNPAAIPIKVAAASAMDEGHRYGRAPALGEGLANAIDKLRQLTPPDAGQVGATFAAFNGENFEAKLWGVARIRHDDLFRQNMVIRHPADTFGDTGAASGAILTALGAHALSNGQVDGSALIWAASDRDPRGCALLSI
jgi:3-oxoacyl-[acyl-carrier-protein] synthase-1